MAAPSMDALAERYVRQGVGATFLYTHEAHPGEHYPHHTSLEQKFRHARDLRDILGVRREIVVDSLDGACHRAYGSMPNMTWIFTKSRVPIYKSDWTGPESVENALAYFIQAFERRRAGSPMVPFRVERFDLRLQDREAFVRGLERNGLKAVEEYRRAFG